MNGPNPGEKHPIKGVPEVCFIKNTVKNPNIVIGDYTFYEDPDGAEDFEKNNVLYPDPAIGGKLVIGKFCLIARGVRFLMNGALHKMNGISAYPFSQFGQGWEAAAPAKNELPFKGDTVVGNDVLIGYDSVIMPGIKIGDGAIIATRSLVSHDVLPYNIVAGNPARIVRPRYYDSTVAELLAIRWWDWDIEKITRNLKLIVSGDIKALKAAK